jgi:hypothetical protein
MLVTADRCKMHLMDHERDLESRELLRDVGWLPSDLNCEEKRRLAQEYLDATSAWFEVGRGRWLRILDRLRQAYKGLSKELLRPGKYEALDAAIDEARLKAARARLALEAHIAAHNC